VILDESTTRCLVGFPYGRLPLCSHCAAARRTDVQAGCHQERLNRLAMCSIEKDILDTIDLDSVLEDLHKKRPKTPFKKTLKHRAFI
jgi:hypothetical protein